MKKFMKQLIAFAMSVCMLLSLCINGVSAAPAEATPEGASGGVSTNTTETYRCVEGPWSFTLKVTTDSATGSVTKAATITAWEIDRTADNIIIPSVLGGAEVTAISATAITRSGSVNAVYIPSTVQTIAEFAFYDLNALQYISCANPSVIVEDGALASCNSQTIRTTGTPVTVRIVNGEKAAIAGGSYLANDPYNITAEDILGIASGTFTSSDAAVTFTGNDYEAKETNSEVKIADSLNGIITTEDLHYTFRDLTAAGAAESLNKEIAEGSFRAVSKGLVYETGYYLNGSKVLLDANAKGYDVATGDEIPIVSTGGAYTYVADRDNDNDGDIDALYYTDASISVTLDQSGTVLWPENSLCNGKGAAKTLEGKYLAFANGVLEATGTDDTKSYSSVVVADTATAAINVDGSSVLSDAVAASLNRERSVLWANDYGSISTKYLNAVSTSYASWAREAFEAGDSTYNYELNMQYGLNAALYATVGGQLSVGDMNGETSYIETNGDTGNGIISIGGGSEVGSTDAPYQTSKVSLVNAVVHANGWNSHVADAIYGGYIYLKQVTGTTGVYGSYLGQSSALANDFGAGVVVAEDCDFTTYGNGSAGAYVIGADSGVIKATNTNFTSVLGAALCTAGGTFDITGGTAKGINAFRARGDGAESTLTNVNLVKTSVADSYSDYVTGAASYEAAQAWAAAYQADMPGPEMSNQLVGRDNMTIGKICDAYGISTEKRTALYAELDRIATKYGFQSGYSDSTLWRCSLFDSDQYGHPVASVGKIVSAGGVLGDYSAVPYLNWGVGSEGLQTSSVLEYQAAKVTATLNNCAVSYEGTDRNYDYLLAAESAAQPTVVFDNCANLSGIIWNEGVKSSSSSNAGGGVNQANSDTGTMTTTSGGSSINVTFSSSVFTGCFADGSNGLWNVEGLSYTNNAGETTSLNGNYYCASANYGISAIFDENSTWIVTHDSYIGTLTIADGATVKAEAPVTVFYKNGTVPTTAVNVTFVKLCDFSDLSGYDWAIPEISYLMSEGILYGTSETIFAPGLDATLQEYILMLYRTINQDTEVSDDQTALAWISKYAASAGVEVSGLDATGSITRETALTLTAVVLGLDSGTTNDLAAFTDASDINSLTVPYIGALVKAGVIEGDDSGSLNPSGTLTRAEMAMILYRTLNAVANR